MRRHTLYIALHESLVRLGAEVVLGAEPDFHVVGSTGDVAEVVPAVKRIGPDLLLLDTSFQHGRESLLKDVREAGPGIKILMMVAHGDGECTLRSLLAGPRRHLLDDSVLRHAQECCLLALRQSASGCISKSAPPDQLVAALRAIAAGEVWTGPGLAAWFRDTIQPGRLTAEHPPMTARELEIVGLVTDGLSNKEIADRLGISEQTVKNHIAHIMEKLEVRNRVELALVAVRERLA